MKIITACSGGQCVKVAHDQVRNMVLVFDELGNSCEFEPLEWVQFINGVKEGLFDIERLQWGPGSLIGQNVSLSRIWQGFETPSGYAYAAWKCHAPSKVRTCGTSTNQSHLAGGES